ncbi:cyclic nucleotide-binding domain-containing protein [Roseofilum casamattae]|uniref:Mechanosensitive ion channel n=1 Tax=Roseofilum casamattae BLCC-M143 TaxID=3022442 RepID=A0ABT7BT72_9CYAN|nr:cyclic nucleotide-binding domain-containing protein [Roseofilum casamattae]MDJ1182380.1 mechanosensitive ion channel [Roseofilum casamattae BLCC-M143]
MSSTIGRLWQSLFNLIGRISNTSILTIGDEKITAIAIVNILISLVLVIGLSRLLKNFLKLRLLRRLKIDEGNRQAISTIVSYGVSTIGFLVILQSNGFDVASLTVLAGGLGVGIGLGLQSVTKNFTSGLTLLVEHKLRVGDFIEFDGMDGYVSEISLRSTLIRTRRGGSVIVPNSNLVENVILNWNYEGINNRIHIPVGVEYGSDPVLVTEALLKAAYMEPAVHSEPPPKVMFIEFGDSALNFELWVWVTRADLEPHITSSLNYLIEYYLRQYNIVVPFPQTDLWLRNPESLYPMGGKDSHVREYLEEPKPPAITLEKPLTLRDLLPQVAYFENFTELELRQLIEVGCRRRLRGSQVLFREGDPGDAFYIVLSGTVEVYVDKINKHLTNLGPGKFFGELSLMLGIPRTASVRATEETIVFAINHKGFEQLLREHPELSEVIVQEFAKHQEELSERQQQLRDLGLVDAEEDDKNPVVWVRKRLKNLFGL